MSIKTTTTTTTTTTKSNPGNTKEYDSFFDIEFFYKSANHHDDIVRDHGKVSKIQSQINRQPYNPKMMIKKPMGHYTLVFMTPFDDDKRIRYGIDKTLIDFLKMMNEDFTTFSKSEKNESFISEYLNAVYSFCRFFSEQTHLIHVDMDTDSYATWVNLPIWDKKQTSKSPLGVNMDSGLELDLHSRNINPNYYISSIDHLNSFGRNDTSKEKKKVKNVDTVNIDSKNYSENGFFGNFANYVWYGQESLTDVQKSFGGEKNEPHVVDISKKPEIFLKNIDHYDISRVNIRKSETETDYCVSKSNMSTTFKTYDRIHTFNGILTVVNVPDCAIILKNLQNSKNNAYLDDGVETAIDAEINIVTSFFKTFQHSLYDFYLSREF
jgi:hypothetical protein